MSEKKPNMLIIGVILVIAALSVAATVVDIVRPLDLSTYPPAIAYILGGVKYILIVTPIAILVAFGRNIFGFGINWIREQRNGDSHVEYSLSWLAQTIVTFEGVIIVATPLVTLIAGVVFKEFWPAYESEAMIVIGSLWALIDLTISELKRALKSAGTPIPVATIPVKPS